MKKLFFTEKLMAWHRSGNLREMPWKGIKDPYKVWLSEIILQQTRVEQGLPYYERFIQKYPDIFSLAKAKDVSVMKMWEGLGYYSRCRNLLHTARFIVKHHNGIFPGSYDELLQLKGIGSYTAAAIASFCFNLPYAVLDGNVFRVLSRIGGVEIPTDSTEGRKVFTQMAHKLLDKQNPGIYNQAIMDFGATICKPAVPTCAICPVQHQCMAYLQGKVNFLPIKEKVIRKKGRWFNYLIFTFQNKKLVQQRLMKDIWQELYEYFLIETTANMHWTNESITLLLRSQLNINETHIKELKFVPAEPQKLTHQEIKGWFIEIELKKCPTYFNNKNFYWLSPAELKKKAFPKFINQYQQNNS